MRIPLIVVVGAALVAAFGAASAHAEIVCRKKSGVLVVREACKPRETAFDLAGAEPTPTARAYGCSNPLSDTTVEACPGRPSKGIVSVTANTANAGQVCFELDPSIDADAVVVGASLNTHSSYSGGKINALIGADGYSNYNGCPPNSVLVNTARHTNTGSSLGLEAVILGVTIVVP